MIIRTPQQRASASWQQRQRDNGWRKITVWFDPAQADKLELLRAQEGSLDKAVGYAVRMCPTRAQIAEAKDAMASAMDITTGTQLMEIYRK